MTEPPVQVATRLRARERVVVHVDSPAARWVGAGRLHADQSIDPVAGVELLVGIGDRVIQGQPVAVIHCRDEWVGERGRELAETCFAIAPEAAEPRPIVLERGRGGA